MPFLHYRFKSYLVELTMFLVISESETVHPGLLVEVHQHPLFQLVLAVVDGDGVVVAVEAVDQSLDRRLLEVTQHGCGLSEIKLKSQIRFTLFYKITIIARIRKRPMGVRDVTYLSF